MKIIAFVVALLLFVGGLYVMALAFDTHGYETLVFLGGILMCALAVAIPAHVLKRIDA